MKIIANFSKNNDKYLPIFTQSKLCVVFQAYYEGCNQKLDTVNSL